MDLNAIDFIILIVILISTLIGLYRGVIREIYSLIVWSIAFWLSIFHNSMLATRLEFIEAPSMKHLVAAGIIFLTIIIIGAIISLIMGRVLKLGALSGVDRIFGMVFGVIRGVIITTVCVWAVKFTPVAEFESWHSSTLVSPTNNVIKLIEDKVPKQKPPEEVTQLSEDK